MNLELFGVPVQQIAAWAGAALLTSVGGVEGFKALRPILAGVLAKFRAAKSVRPSVNADPLVEAADALYRAAQCARDAGRPYAVRNVLAALCDLMNNPEETKP